MNPKAFSIAIPDAELVELRRRLAATRWSDDFGNAEWTYGVERGWLEDMIAYWHDRFDWRAQEEKINRHPQFRVEIDGIMIHFLHVRGRRPGATPLVLTHGWPWTFWDYQHLIGPLTDPDGHGAPDAPCFDLIIPSLPGFGFSSPLRTTGVDVPRIAGLWLKLMTEVLGYPAFAASGGDWGAAVTAQLGHAFADVVQAVHIMFPTVPGQGRFAHPEEAYAPDERWMIAYNQQGMKAIQSHITVQSTDPQTLAYALADSPTGMAAWLWERRRAWSDCNGDVLSVFSRDDLCTTAAIYWFTGTIGSSMRIYAEAINRDPSEILVHNRSPLVEAPTAYAVFPRDNLHTPRSIMARNTNLKRHTMMPRGGHFGAFEQPDLVVEDLRGFIASL